MIPGLAVKRVEVLRDGAASQYGSDAIAGVINFILKDADEGGTISAQYGQFFDDEDSLHVGANMGFAIGDSGFVNATIEYIDNEGLSRGVQRPDAQALIDGGNSAVGQDAVFGDAPLAQSWGRPETEGTRLFREFTRAHINDRLAAIIDGSVVTAPVIRSVVPTSRTPAVKTPSKK